MRAFVLHLDVQLAFQVSKKPRAAWRFEYSKAFKSQTELAPLNDFPNKDKVYQSQMMFPFFMSRIPSVKQPKVQTVIEAEHIDATSELALLKRFGEKSIANPFVLSS